MFFGRELNKPAVWMRKDDAIAAAKWVQKQGRRYILCILPVKSGGYAVFRGLTDPITVGYLAALMQRHDKPPVLEPYMVQDGIMRSRDNADVPFMAALPYYDVLPKERPA